MFSGLFSRKTSLVGSSLLEGAVDNHSHLLYGVDDGVKTQEEALYIMGWMEKRGIKELWLTPHIMEDVPNTTRALQERFAELQEAYKGGIRLRLSAEYMMDNLFQERLAADDLLLHSNDWVLMETSTVAPPIDFWGMIEATMSAGYRPLLAHPERYAYMSPRDYARLHEMGVLFQLNLPSIVGYYGSEVRTRAQDLLSRGWYNMAGSDCHRFRAVHHQYEAEELKKATVKLLRPLMVPRSEFDIQDA